MILSMKILLFFILIFIGGCAHHAQVISSAGTIGPGLKNPLPKNQAILVLAVLRDVKTDIVSENIFTYEKLGSVSIPAEQINHQLSQTVKTTLKKFAYYQVNTQMINTLNVLNSTDIQTLEYHSQFNLTSDAQAFLRKELINKNVDTLILITQSDDQALGLDLKCELSKNNIYYQASLQAHLDLYKIYFIDARTLKIITWLTGSANEYLQDTHLCKPLSQFSAQDTNELKYLVMNGLNKALAADLAKTLND